MLFRLLLAVRIPKGGLAANAKRSTGLGSEADSGGSTPLVKLLQH